MIIVNFKDSPNISMGFEMALVRYCQTNGPIISLDKLAHAWGVSGRTARKCAHSAADKGKLKLTRLENANGRPYEVRAEEEEKHHEE